MVRQSVKLFSCVTFLLFLIFRCTTIYPSSFKFSENGQDKISNQGPNSGRTSQDSNRNLEQTASKKNDDSINIANPADVEFFRDPVEVLGPNFTQTVVVNLCNAHLIVTADIVSEVIFLDEGTQLCDKICTQYLKIMELDGLMDSFLMKRYCDYIGTTDFSDVSEQDDQFDLNTACTCAYKVRRDHRTNVIMYTFQANSAGFLNVLFSIPNQKLIRH